MTTQITQVVPGQTVRLQFAHKSSASGTSVKVKVETSPGGTSWATLDSLDVSYNQTAWTPRAFDLTLPVDTSDGRVRISLWKSGTGSGYIDDVIIVTNWAKVTYDTSSPGVGYGLPINRYGLRVCDIGVLCATGTVQTQLQYAAGVSPSPHPAIFPTTTIANLQNGTPGPGADEDVTSTASYDPWGRQLAAKDPDLVETESVYAANQTDVASTKDGLDNPTTMTYDEVGNVKKTATPLGRETAQTYDVLNHVLTTTRPDGVVSKTDYNNYGQATATWENYVNGVVESTDADDTDDLLSKMVYDRFGRVETQKADCGSVADCEGGGLAAKSTTTYDLLGNTVVATAYPNADGNGTARPTTNFFETFDPPSTSSYDLPNNGLYSRSAPTGIQLAIKPTSGSAPLCPGSGTEKCNTITTVDLSGRATRSTDAYGVVTKVLLDLNGRPTQTLANYVLGGSGADENIETVVEYSVLGEPQVSWDPLDRRNVNSFDALGRLTKKSHRDTAGTEFLKEETEYLPSGRTSRTSDGASWTKTEYDGAGRAVRTINNHSQGNAGMTLEAFEGDLASWSTDFVTGMAFLGNDGATMTTDTDSVGNTYDLVTPFSGRGRMRLTTHASNANTGAWLNLSGPTYQSNHTYKASFDVAASAGGLTFTAYLGRDVTSGSSGNLVIASSTTWERKTVSWTVPNGSNFNTDVHFALKNNASGTAQIYLDNLVIWDTYVDATPTDWSKTGIVSSVSAYNKDGEIAASALPPGDPASATERPLVTTVGFDQAGRTVATTVNGASGAYAAAVKATASLVGYFPLDERIVLPAADQTSVNNLAGSGAPRLAIAGGIDEARTGMAFAGGAYLSRGSNATPNTTNVSMEAWLRTDAGNPAQTVVVAANGTATNGWGIGVDTSGRAAAFAIASSTLTPMSSTATVADGRWHHVVLTRGASTWAMTVDGTATTLTPNNSNPGATGAGFSIGALPGGSRPFSGDVDEVSIYTTDISGSTAAAHWAVGRRLSSDSATALTSRSGFDRLGRTTDAWDAKLVRGRAGYDRLGNQVETTLNYQNGDTNLPAGVDDDDVKSTFAYNVLGELVGYCPAVQVVTTTCDPGDTADVQAWRYTFDNVGRQTKTIPPDNGVVQDLSTSETVYETGGHVAKTCTYPVGQSCGAYESRHGDFTYDDLGQVLTQKTYDRGASPATDTLKFTKSMTWAKDGQPDTVTEGTTTFKYVYDSAGRPSEFKNQTTSTSLTQWTYTTDLASRVATRKDVSLSSSVGTAFSYDYAGRVTKVDPPDTYVSGVVTRTYRLDGLLATQAFPSSVTETLSYDAAKRPTGIDLGSGSSLSQAYDRAGNVASDGRALTGFTGTDAGANTQSFSYDALGRLTSSTLSSATRSYTYDLNGNRTRKVEGGTTIDYTYAATDQLIKQTIGVVDKISQFDRYGNLLQAADNANVYTSYAYDEASRLTSISPAGGTAATFTIDPLDRHGQRTVGAATDTYGYVGPSEMAFETSSTGTRSLLDLDGSRLAVKNGSTVAWVIFDLHGSIAALCTAGGTTLSDAYRYDGFGQTVATGGSSTNPWKYRGLLTISPGTSDTLYDMFARDYSPSRGAFTQVDSVQGSAANPLTMNRYLYALANPATLIDPDGHRGCLPDAGNGCEPVPYRPYTPPPPGGGGPGGHNGDGGGGSGDGASNPTTDVCDRGCERGETFTGYAPWELRDDAYINAVYEDAVANCIAKDQDDPACQIASGIEGWKAQMSELWCSYHRADCDAYQNQEEHARLGFASMFPLIGTPSSLWDARNYFEEGDVGGGLLAIIFSVPGAKLVGKAFNLGEAAVKGNVFVYRFVDAAGDVRYVGITNDLARRGAEHLRQSGITIDPIPGLSNLTRTDARAVEQVLIEAYGGAGGSQLRNKINSIAKGGSFYDQSIVRGCALLFAAKYSFPAGVC